MPATSLARLCRRQKVVSRKVRKGKCLPCSDNLMTCDLAGQKEHCELSPLFSITNPLLHPHRNPVVAPRVQSLSAPTAHALIKSSSGFFFYFCRTMRTLSQPLRVGNETVLNKDAPFLVQIARVIDCLGTNSVPAPSSKAFVAVRVNHPLRSVQNWRKYTASSLLIPKKGTTWFGVGAESGVRVCSFFNPAENAAAVRARTEENRGSRKVQVVNLSKSTEGGVL